MNHTKTLLGALALVIACGGDGEPGAVAAVFPETGYTGTTETVLISGNVTTWSDASTVSFGDGVTVVGTELVGPSSIMATVEVSNDAAPGSRTVTVDSDSLQEGFAVAPSLALSAEGPRGTMAQGSVVTLTVANQNPSAVFDTTSEGDGLFSPITYPNFSVELSGSSAVAQVASVTPTEATISVLIDVGAEVGVRDLTITNGPEGEARTLVLGSALDVEERSAEEFDFVGSTLEGKQEAVAASRLFAIDPAPTDGDIELLDLSIFASDENASMSMILLGPSGSFQELVDIGSALTFTNLEGGYLIVFDRSPLTGFDYALDAGNTNLGPLLAEPSPEDNEDEAAALETDLNSITSAALTSETDADWYAVTLDEDTTLTAFTQGGDAQSDPVLAIWDASDMTEPLAEVDNDFHETLADVPLEAGDYYVVVSQSDYFPYDPQQTDYNLVITGVPGLPAEE